MFTEMGVNVVETEEANDDEKEEADDEPEAENELVEVQQKVPAKAETKEPTERTDDPVRMYLREMGSVELLSREGEIAIAKRIEAGREAMIAGLCESPLTFQAIIIWRDELNEDKVFLRDIIDLEATYAGPDAKAMPAPVGPDGQPLPAAFPARPTAGQPPQTLAPADRARRRDPVQGRSAAGRRRGRRRRGEAGRRRRRRFRRRRYGGLALARRDRGRAEAQGARDLRHRGERVQAAAPPAGPGHRAQAQERHR